jgi:2-C-methyl-D-erythritol 4-phosphate cytidylyltransferase
VTTWVIVVAAGTGSRFGGAVPKQYLAVGDQRVLDLSLANARSRADGVVLVVAGDRLGDPEPAADVVVAGGATRSESVRNGLAAVPTDADVILVHDAARPSASPSLFAAVIDAIRAGADAAVPGIAVADTIKRIDGDVVVETLRRDELVAVQTPQGFAGPVLRAAHASHGEGTDDAALVEAAGGKVVVVPGDVDNHKITVTRDLDDLLARRSGASG